MREETEEGRERDKQRQGGEKDWRAEGGYESEEKLKMHGRRGEGSREQAQLTYIAQREDCFTESDTQTHIR